MRQLVIIVAIAAIFVGCDESKSTADSETSATTVAETSASDAPDETAETAQTEGSDDAGETCEQAYADLEALVKGLEEQLGPSDAGMPDRTAFVEKCQSLPDEVQKCMVFEYGMANKEACEKRVAELDPDARKRAQELMGK